MQASTELSAIPDLTDAGTFAKQVPHQVFDEIRSRSGLYWQPTEVATANGGFWAVTRFADILEIERNPTLFASRFGAIWPGTNQSDDPEINPQLNILMFMDPPRHSRVRRAAAASFGPRVVANFEPWVRETVIEVLDRIETLDTFDYVEECASMVPSLVIAKILGVPESDRPKIVDWTTRSFVALQDDDAMTKAMMVMYEMMSYIAGTLQPEKLKNPQDDVTTVLTHAHERGEITSEEALFSISVMIQAGFETTHTLIGQSMRMILEDPDVEQKVLRAIPEIGAERVVDEFLRFVTPVMNMARTATEDTMLGGQQIRSGDLMQMYFIAANRDPEVFENPHEFDPWRPQRDSLAFGSGPHRCLGAALAKLELRILFEELAERGIALRLNGSPQRGWSQFINQLRELPVARV